MKASQIRTLASGEMMTASEWNTVVQAVQAQETPSAWSVKSGPLGAQKQNRKIGRKRTLARATVDIASNSLIALKAVPEENLGRNVPILNAVTYTPGDSEILSGFFATNGSQPVQAGAIFNAEILDDQNDVLIEVYGYEEGHTTAGFNPGQQTAKSGEKGLIITSAYDKNRGLFYVRKASIADAEPEAVICRTVGISDAGVYRVETYSKGVSEPPDDSEGMLIFLSLALGPTVPAGTFAIAHRASLESVQIEDI